MSNEVLEVELYIKEASELSGATQRAIRLYESLGLLTVSRSGKYRIYTETNVNLIKMIKEAQTLGIKLSEIVDLKDDKGSFDWQTVRDFLIDKQKDIELQIQQLEEQRDRLVQYRESITICIEGVDSHL
ncbi:putative transcriptional regulator, MerR family [Vibrio nigripulchritudo MADA3029]|uniref:MerR family transcriptional regulator n=1 Tax=Vibrio nigripulchritudo TaxID=28173 RepID=UPI00021C25E4|nr:MerR family transcriptional regulator [Vibrio nigripulchritudo]EGU61587.1 MerR family transcriptional regulator [Vibrio nigripulchritudo ATCC 27043]CCN36935.1 putative transcriptional regulator, MerR family [Vibrio nigripulchritudo AM115]CCN41841.1 putative transcriptional regulator, MerR family [Vibrio nigripulchritudo FTn2]CCN45575.1 putative transcriptional regulator, MerR family [Vibrio nigripulchritudo MADA3020]CCN55828.1 putative transcriptional regulator, MerR family [Vibrio nigripul